MEQNENNEPVEELKQEPKMEPRRRRAPKKASFKLPAFLSNFLDHLGEDVRWYFDIRIWSPLLLILFILALALPRGSRSAEEVSVVTATEPAIEETAEATEPTEAPINEEAAALARLADTVGSGRSDNVKTAIMWVAINRSEAGGTDGYGQSLLEEIARENQWQGYDENASYSEHTYEIALNALEIQSSNGLRPIDSGMIYLVLNEDGSVTLRNQFNETAATQKKTIK